MGDEELKAKVFISCGQHTCEERAIAREIEEALRREGYDPYVAVQKQTLRDLRHNIFNELEDSEYIVFVDFKREALLSGGTPLWKRIFQSPKGLPRRGSVFCHQELAVASYLDLGTERDMEILAFHEKGIKQPDGMMGALQVNSQEFTDPGCLPKLIADHARKRWKPHWKNQLRLDVNDPPFRDAFRLPEKINARFFHIRATNLNHSKLATHCYAYLEAARDLRADEDIPLETAELKWEGYRQPDVVILPDTNRCFDAFWVSHDQPSHACFNLFSDSTRFYPQLPHAGDYRLTYCVVSDNFPPARITCSLRLDDDLSKVALVAVDGATANRESRKGPSGNASPQPYGESSLSAIPQIRDNNGPEPMSD